MAATFDKRAETRVQLVTCSPDWYIQYILYKTSSSFLWKALWSILYDLTSTLLDSYQPILNS